MIHIYYVNLCHIWCCWCVIASINLRQLGIYSLHYDCWSHGKGCKTRNEQDVYPSDSDARTSSCLRLWALSTTRTTEDPSWNRWQREAFRDRSSCSWESQPYEFGAFFYKSICTMNLQWFWYQDVSIISSHIVLGALPRSPASAGKYAMRNLLRASQIHGKDDLHWSPSAP